QPSFLILDRAVFNEPIDGENGRIHSALFKGESPIKFLTESDGNIPVTPSLHTDTQSLALTNPAEPRPLRSLISSAELSLELCLRQTNFGRTADTIEGSEHWDEELVQQTDSKNLEEFLVSPFFSDLFSKKYFPTLNDIQSAFKAFQILHSHDQNSCG